MSASGQSLLKMSKMYLAASALLVGTAVMAVVLFALPAAHSPPHHLSERDDCSLFQKQLEELQVGHQRTNVLLNKLLCLAKEVLPSGGFCLDNNKLVVGGNNMWSGQLCAGLEQLFGNTTVADLGAGLGHYGRCFLRRSEGILNHPNKVEIENINKDYLHQMARAGLHGTPQVIKSWHGWDGAANIDEFTNGRIASADLSSPATLGGPFDWVMSLEVGEHIPESGEKNFLDNLVKHACVGVVLSWAVPGQGGHSHVNCRSNDYVRKEMAAQGLESDKLAEVKLRKNVDQLTYFMNTLMVFRYPKKRC
ncbi:uncharacterized protein [Procambarus clarkii]|uniref:uncharacterized protein isoform X1 n=2 Tax=Procambarus clarkii TaxID=6728 RepID=UPI0037435142